MSLINKMLQDLDARHTAASEAAELYTKPVARSDNRPGVPLLVGLSVCVVAVAVGGALGWRYWQKTRPVQVVAKPARAVNLPRSVQPTRVITPAPAGQASAPAPAPAQVVVPAPAAAQVAASAANPAAAHAPASAPASVTASTPATVPEVISAPVKNAEPKHARTEPEARRSSTTAADSKKHTRRRESNDARDDAKVGPSPAAQAVHDKPAAAHKHKEAPAKVSGAGKEETAAQKAETAYRRALSSMQEGYVSDAISELEHALQANPHHDAARQTLVSLLVENHRADEAMRQLQTALTLDPRQPSMAMLLARLQIERGGNGVETLMRTLAYVGSNGEYRAFLAGALQRQQRHREAVEQYQAALRDSSQNGVWWMGLGISLQAEKRNAEALDAFRKAKASGTLTPELLAFVENKIQQLSR